MFFLIFKEHSIYFECKYINKIDNNSFIIINKIFTYIKNQRTSSHVLLTATDNPFLWGNGQRPVHVSGCQVKMFCECDLELNAELKYN